MEFGLPPETLAIANTTINAVSLWLLRKALVALKEIRHEAEKVRADLLANRDC